MSDLVIDTFAAPELDLTVLVLDPYGPELDADELLESLLLLPQPATMRATTATPSKAPVNCFERFIDVLPSFRCGSRSLPLTRRKPPRGSGEPDGPSERVQTSDERSATREDAGSAATHAIPL